VVADRRRRRGRHRRRLALLALGLWLAGTATAETGWSTSAVVSLSSPAYSVSGPTPPCSGRVLVDATVRQALDRFWRGGLEADAPSRASRAVGDALNLFGLDAVLQDHATCAEVCARVPLDATRITSLIAYVDDGPGTPFRTVPFGRWSDYVHWESDVDTTRLGESDRLVCTRVRHWVDFDRRVFMIVRYEQ
jgi:hypothetical protein